MRHGYVFLFVQKNELAELKIDSKAGYQLYLASRSLLEGESNTDDVIEEPTIPEAIAEETTCDVGIDKPTPEG